MAALSWHHGDISTSERFPFQFSKAHTPEDALMRILGSDRFDGLIKDVIRESAKCDTEIGEP